MHSMTDGVRIAESRREFAACWTEVAEVLDANLRLPDWPFLTPSGYVSICQFDVLLGGGFAPVLQGQSAAYGDGEVTLVTLEPLPSYYWKAYAHFPGFRVERASLSVGFGAALSYEPGGIRVAPFSIPPTWLQSLGRAAPGRYGGSATGSLASC